MTGEGTPDGGHERFRRLYEAHRSEGIRFAAALLAKSGATNRYLLGIEAEELFDEAMERYYRDGEHLQDHGAHERHIKHRIKMVRIALLRRVNAEKRRPPGQPVSLEEPVRPISGEALDLTADLSDPRVTHSEEDEVDIRDAIDRIRNPDERAAALARYQGETYAEIAENADVGEEGVRQRVRRARKELEERLEEEP